MTDTETTLPPEGTDEKPQDPEGSDKGSKLPDDPAVLRAELEKVRKEAAGYRTKLREAEPLAAKARELEDASKSEAQKLAEERDQHRQRGDKAEGELARLRVALAKGLTERQAARLVGNTVEELEADADALLEEFAGPADDPKGRRRPTERLRPGAVPDAEPEELDPVKLAEKVAGKGDLFL